MKHFFFKIGKSEIRNIIAVMYIAVALPFIYLLATHSVPKGNEALLNVMGGYILSGVGIILSYFFGSSKNESDAAKNDISEVEATEKKP